MWKNLALLLGSLTVCYVLIEAVSIGLAVFESQEAAEQRLYHSEYLVPDPRYGFRVAANLDRLRVSWMAEEVSGIVSTDAFGFRNVGRDYVESELYFVGDSFTFGSWIEREATFFGLIEKALRQPVVSLGIGGFGMFEYAMVVEDYVLPFEPAVVALCVFANDLTAVPPAIELPESSDRGAYYFGEEGAWRRYVERPPLWQRTFSYNLYNSLATFLATSVESESPAIPPAEVNRKQARDGVWLYRTRGADPHYFTKERDPAIEAKFAEILDSLIERNIRPLVFLFPSKESAYKSEYRTMFPQNATYLEIEETGYQRLCEKAATRSVLCADLTDSFRERVEVEQLYFASDPHWNETGHRLAAKLMLHYLSNAACLAPGAETPACRNPGLP